MARVAPARSGVQRIMEVKRHLDGRVERFACDAVARRRGALVVRFAHRTARRAGGLRIPRGSVTYGFFWPRRSYVLYHMVGPDGATLADRFDVVRDVRVMGDEVSYVDLLLDVWALPDGAVRVEDEDEVADAASRGLLSPEDQRRIARAGDLLARSHRRIVREALALLA